MNTASEQISIIYTTVLKAKHWLCVNEGDVSVSADGAKTGIDGLYLVLCLIRMESEAYPRYFNFVAFIFGSINECALSIHYMIN